MARVAVVLFVISATMLFQGRVQSRMEGTWKDTVFILAPEDTHAEQAQVTMLFEGEHLSPNFTVCVWLWPLYIHTTIKLFTVSDAATSIYVKAKEKKISVAVNTRCSFNGFTNQHLLPNIWQHLCLGVVPGSVLIHFHGETNTRQLVDMDNCSIPIIDSENITVEAGTETGEFAYSGKITGVRYYDRQLTTSEVEGLQNCENSAEDYVLMTEISIFGNVSSYNLTEQQELCLPEAKEFVALFPICGNYLKAKKFCTKLGGRLINKDDNLEKITKEIELSQDVQDMTVFLWIDEMIDQEHGWVLSINRDSGNYLRTTYSYDALFTVIACMMSLGKTVYMKSDEIMPMILYTYNRRLVLVSDWGMIIRRGPCPEERSDGESTRCLAMRYPGMQETYVSLDYEVDIFGRKNWTVDGMQNSMNFTITVCEEGNFTCDDGSCIPLENRCNGVHDCEDYSDEGDLCTVMKPLPASYWMTACPESQPVVGLNFSVVRVHSVSLNTNEFKVNLHVVVLWRDHRLTFQNLQDETQILQPYDFNYIWKPKLIFPEAQYGDNLAMATKTSVLEEFTVQAMDSGQPEIDDSYEVMRFNGSEVEIQHGIQYQFTFSCDFDFHSFPFDTQECDMMVNLKNTFGCNPRWDTGPGRVQVYGKGSTLSMYSISPARYTIAEDGKHVVVKLLFIRKFAAYVMTTFLPCIVLCLLAHVTLTHFQLENFNDRIMVTLSLLIVLASIFSQLSSTLPSSPVSKLVDYFFFYCILRVSLIFLLHTFIEVSRRSTRDTEEGAGAIIKGDDPILGIKMKLAWVSGEGVDTKEPTKQSNKPRIISNVSCVAVLVLDVVVAGLLSFIALSDQSKKNNSFQSCNITVPEG